MNGKFNVGLVHEVIRGANTKVKAHVNPLNPGGTKSKGSKLRLAKPSTVPMKFGCTARVKIMRMERVSPGSLDKGPTYATDCSHQCDCIDPLMSENIASQSILHVFEVKFVYESNYQLVLELSFHADEHIKLIKDRCDQ